MASMEADAAAALTGLQAREPLAEQAGMKPAIYRPRIAKRCVGQDSNGRHGG